MKQGDKVWAPAPDRGGKLRATFLEIAIGEPIEVEGTKRDAAWISYEEGDLEGTTKKVPFHKLRPRDD